MVSCNRRILPLNAILPEMNHIRLGQIFISGISALPSYDNAKSGDITRRIRFYCGCKYQFLPVA